jgi:hypothetical protein
VSDAYFGNEWIISSMAGSRFIRLSILRPLAHFRTLSGG